MKPTLLRFPVEMLTRLQAVADKNGVSLACVVRSIVEDWFKSQRS